MSMVVGTRAEAEACRRRALAFLYEVRASVRRLPTGLAAGPQRLVAAFETRELAGAFVAGLRHTEYEVGILDHVGGLVRVTITFWPTLNHAALPAAEGVPA